MSEPDDVRAQAMARYMARLDALVVNPGDGTSQVDADGIRELVRAEPELTTIVARGTSSSRIKPHLVDQVAMSAGRALGRRLRARIRR